ncbi:MAG: 50S ribosomal protein L35 [Leptospiraceae bacterium]|nr:50S ribosomal protein L35 [Leptospiraceae bacterium]
MPKIKTNRAAAKRFSYTASGKVKRRKAFKNHILTKKNSNRKRKLRMAGMIHEADQKEIRALLPYR